MQLGLLPLLENDLVDTGSLIASSASGVSGAGRQAKVDNLLSEVSDSFKAYGVSGHRHLPEIEQGLGDIADSAVQVTFVPHLLPIIRGIHSTLFAQLKAPVADIQLLFEERYASEPLSDVLPAEVFPQTRTVKGANRCQIAVSVPQGRDMVVVMTVIDNLVKGASGQAIQNMNIMLGSMGRPAKPDRAATLRLRVSHFSVRGQSRAGTLVLLILIAAALLLGLYLGRTVLQPDSTDRMQSATSAADLQQSLKDKQAQLEMSSTRNEVDRQSFTSTARRACGAKERDCRA